MGPPSSLPPGLQRMKPRCYLPDPTPGSPSPQTLTQLAQPCLHYHGALGAGWRAGISPELPGAAGH